MITQERRGAFSPWGMPLRVAATWKSQITIRELLNHYSGLPEDVSLKDDWGLKSPDKAEGIRRAMASIPYGPPGQTFKYSDINFITLGFLVERPSPASDLDQYAQDRHPRAASPFRHVNHTALSTEHSHKACGVNFHVCRIGAVLAKLKPRTFHHPVLVKESCPSGRHWDFEDWATNTAPTAHDDESQSQPPLNPDYDHLLRGTVHDPTTRRMGGVAGHAGLFSTAA